MANNFDNTNDGAIFPNDKKRNENSPNLTGSVCIKCEHCGQKSEYWTSAWVKMSKAGKKFMSLAFNPKEERKPAPKKAATKNPADPYSMEPENDFDDDIPF
tara:strand:+ start:21354 stop:21656 length:303 start_codon:yes stop_codon:yes gene_type:complete